LCLRSLINNRLDWLLPVCMFSKSMHLNEFTRQLSYKTDYNLKFNAHGLEWCIAVPADV
jgi:hypothetical protein